MTIRPAPRGTRRCPAVRRTHARRMRWYVRQMSENRRRGDYRHWVWVLNQGPLVSTTNVFRLEHMLAARTSPTVTASTLKVASPERRMTPHSCNQSRLPSTTSYPPPDGSRQSAQASAVNRSNKATGRIRRSDTPHPVKRRDTSRANRIVFAMDHVSRATPRRGPTRRSSFSSQTRRASRQAHLEQPDRDLTDATHEASRHEPVSSRRIGAVP